MKEMAVTTISAELKKIGIEVDQEYNENANARLQTIFKDLDLNNDNKISSDEISAYEEYLQFKRVNSKEHEELNQFKRKANAPIKDGILAGIAGFAAGAISIDAILASIEHVGTPLKKAVIIAGGALLACLAGYGVYKLVSNKSSVQEAKEEVVRRKDKMKTEDIQVENFDKQYASVNAARANKVVLYSEGGLIESIYGLPAEYSKEGKIKSIGGFPNLYSEGSIVSYSNGFPVEYSKDGRVIQAGGFPVEYSEDGRVIQAGGFPVKYSNDGKIKHALGFPIDYYKDGRIKYSAGFPVEYSKDNLVKYLHGFPVKYSNNEKVEFIDDEISAINSLIIQLIAE